MHIHGGQIYHLKPHQKECKVRGVDTVKSLKADVWDLFSEWVRRKDADSSGYVQCITCGKKLLWKECDAGHYISRRHNSTFIDERNVKPQCKWCNGFGHGMETAFKQAIINLYGENVEATLQMLKKRNHKFTAYELNQYKKLYQDKLAGLAGKVNIELNNLPF
jgi:hypothetical protein